MGGTVICCAQSCCWYLHLHLQPAICIHPSVSEKIPAETPITRGAFKAAFDTENLEHTCGDAVAIDGICQIILLYRASHSNCSSQNHSCRGTSFSYPSHHKYALQQASALPSGRFDACKLLAREGSFQLRGARSDISLVPTIIRRSMVCWDMGFPWSPLFWHVMGEGNPADVGIPFVYPSSGHQEL